jgi:hypothetical protein
VSEHRNVVSSMTLRAGSPAWETARAYLNVLNSHQYLLSQAKAQRLKRRRKTIQRWAGLMDRIYGQLLEARVFHIPEPRYLDAWIEADRYVTEEIAGLTWRRLGALQGDGKGGESTPFPEIEAYLNAVAGEAERVPFPDRLPFASMYLGFGQGIQVPLHTLLLKLHAISPDVVKAFKDATIRLLNGILVTADGLVVEVLAVGHAGVGQVLMHPLALSRERGWEPEEYSLGPRVTHGLLSVLAEYRTFVVEDPSTQRFRQEFRALQARVPEWAGRVPPPFYTVRLRQSVIRERLRQAMSPQQRRPLAYRHDVRGHERVYVRRGPLPLRGAERRLQERRGFTVFEDAPLSEDLAERLTVREIPRKRPGEWLAVKVTWVQAHVSPLNEALPYVPSTHVLPLED